MTMIKKIVLAGTGGYGIKFLGHALGEFFVLKGYKVVLTFEYDAAMRGGEIVGYLTYGDEHISSPVIDNADYLLLLDKVRKKIKAKKIIVEKQVCGPDCDTSSFLCETCLVRDFRGDALEKFKDKRVVNMIAFGDVLNELGFKISDDELKKVLPDKFFATNLEAVKFGLRYKE
jgi:Pyruvate/2-oxoacid:ferredoxin oxidoreductase gamma subunit